MRESGRIDAIHKSKTDLVYGILKKEILNNRWGTGERRNAQEIAKALGVSRTPVNEASKLLELEGLLKVLPQVGLEVPELTPQEVEEIFQIRSALLGLATAQASKHITEKSLKALQELDEEMDRCISAEDFDGFIKCNRKFHQMIYESCRMPHLIMLVERYLDSSYRYSRYFRFLPEILNSSAQNHKEILDALKKRDFAAAKSAGERDALHFGETLSAYLARNEQEKEERS
jgi:DNA-binding GntR family transcriptional regulator